MGGKTRKVCPLFRFLLRLLVRMFATHSSPEELAAMFKKDHSVKEQRNVG
jgi:hypothetical protein